MDDASDLFHTYFNSPSKAKHSVRSDQTCGEEPGAQPRGTHHVPEVGAQRPRGLVVLHDAVVVEDFPAALTAAEIRQALRPLRATTASVSPPVLEGVRADSY